MTFDGTLGTLLRYEEDRRKMKEENLKKMTNMMTGYAFFYKQHEAEICQNLSNC